MTPKPDLREVPFVLYVCHALIQALTQLARHDEHWTVEELAAIEGVKLEEQTR